MNKCIGYYVTTTGIWAFVPDNIDYSVHYNQMPFESKVLCASSTINYNLLYNPAPRKKDVYMSTGELI